MTKLPSPENGFSPESSARKSRIRRAIELISELISISNSTKVFQVKWNSIRIKLEELLDMLCSLENSDGSAENRKLSSSVKSISATAQSCLELANRCVELSYSGKLLMQSDLDIVSVKLDKHIKNIGVIHSMVLQKQSSAIVVSKPSSSASSNDIKFYIVDLVSRMKIGCERMKKQALVAFNEAIREDERYVKAAIEIDNFVPLLLSLLDSSEVQPEASEAVCVILGFRSYRATLVLSGAIAQLVRALERGGDAVRDYAVRSLMKLTENSDNAWSVSSHGGVTILLKICENCKCNWELVALACGVLKNLAGVEEIKRFMIEENSIPLFINLVTIPHEATQITVIDLLQCMALRDESTKQTIIKKGGVNALVSILDPKSSFSSKSREMALRGTVNLCNTSSDDNLKILLSIGFLDHILHFLRFGESSVQELALKSVSWLCEGSDAAKRAIGEKGIMQEMVKFLNSRSYEVGEIAAQTLSNMLSVPMNRKRFLQDDGNVGLVLRLLDPKEKRFGDKKILLSIVRSLARLSGARKRIVNSGYLKSIEKLAGDEVSDAQKIVSKLCSNRFRNILSRLWSS